MSVVLPSWEEELRNPTLFYGTGGACGGDALAAMGVPGQPHFLDLVNRTGIDVIWQPAISLGDPYEVYQAIIDHIQRLTVFVFEGSVITAPNGTGKYHMRWKKPNSEIVRNLCNAAAIVIAIGICSSNGGIPAAPPNLSGSIGLQLPNGGLLGEGWRSRLGLPVINLFGCATPAQQFVDTVAAALRSELVLDRLGRPQFVQPCLATNEDRKCRTREELGRQCSGCIAAANGKFPLPLTWVHGWENQ